MTDIRVGVGDELTWNGIKLTVQAWRETPDGKLLYCTYAKDGKLEADWFKASDCKQEEEANA